MTSLKIDKNHNLEGKHADFWLSCLIHHHSRDAAYNDMADDNGEDPVGLKLILIGQLNKI